MKLITKIGKYHSPLANQGTFEGAYIEDLAINHKRTENYLAVTFGLRYEQNGTIHTLGKCFMEFYGLESEISIKGKTSNKPSLVDVPNPDYDPNFLPNNSTSDEDIKTLTTQYYRKNLIEVLLANGGDLPKGSVIVDFGWPTYERVKTFFNGGQINSPELTVNNSVAIGFLLSKGIINGEPMGIQFELES